MTASSHACTADSNAASGSCHDVRTAASRVAFSAYACSRARNSSVTAPSTGHTPKMFCSRNNPVVRSGGGVVSVQLSTSSVHCDGTCDSTPMRARTSSPRLVSWVLNDTIVCGQNRARVAARW